MTAVPRMFDTAREYDEYFRRQADAHNAPMPIRAHLYPSSSTDGMAFLMTTKRRGLAYDKKQVVADVLAPSGTVSVVDIVNVYMMSRLVVARNHQAVAELIAVARSIPADARTDKGYSVRDEIVSTLTTITQLPNRMSVLPVLTDLLSRNYALPSEDDPDNATTWCERFGVPNTADGMRTLVNHHVKGKGNEARFITEWDRLDDYETTVARSAKYTGQSSAITVYKAAEAHHAVSEYLMANDPRQAEKASVNGAAVLLEDITEIDNGGQQGAVARDVIAFASLPMPIADGANVAVTIDGDSYEGRVARKQVRGDGLAVVITLMNVHGLKITDGQPLPYGFMVEKPYMPDVRPLPALNFKNWEARPIRRDIPIDIVVAGGDAD